MTRRLTVWTRVEAKGVPAALALLRHLDAQTLPVEDWELVISTAPSALSAALEFAVSHRPNVRLVVGAEELVDPEGDWVLRLALDDRLEASALSRLVDIGGQSGGHDQVTVEASHPLGSVVARPLELHRGGPGASGAAGVSGAARHVAVRVPLRHAAGLGVHPAAASALEGVVAEVRWDGGVLELRGCAPQPAGSVREASVLVVGRASGRLDAHPAVAASAPQGAVGVPGVDGGLGAPGADGTHEAQAPVLAWSAGIPVSGEIPDEVLEVWLELEVGEADEAPRTLRGRVGAAAKEPVEAPAVLHGRPVGVHWQGGGLVIDVGATARSLLGSLEARLSDVVEDATGSLLTVALPGLAHVGEGVVEGSLVLGEVVLPGRLVLDDERAQLQCRVGALPGRLALRTRFGGVRPVDSGCELVTSPTGEYTLVPAPRPVGPAAGPGQDRERPRATGAVAALRRRLPRRVDPLVSRLARVRVLRGTYRRLTGLR